MQALTVALLCTCAHLGVARAQDPGESEYRQALQLAQDGRTDDALALFADVVAAHPNNARYRYDYASVLGWAQRDEQVLRLFRPDELETLPPYVLDTIGKAARNLRRYDLAERAYRISTERDPGRLQAQVGLGYAMSESGHSAEAIRHLEPIANAHPDNPSVLSALAAAYSGAEQHVQALDHYERVLALHPDDSGAKRGRIFAAARMGATQRAYELAQADPALISDAERHTLALDRAAVLLRWDTLQQPPGTPRYQATDEAIAAMEQTLKELNASDESSLAMRRRVQRDLIAAYQQRHRSADTVATYEALKKNDTAIPVYVTLDAADAQLALREPEQARALYKEALVKEPTSLRAKMGVFYSTMDAGEYEGAISWADQVAAEHANAGSGERLSTQSAAALSRAWSDDLAGAQERLEALVAQAPNSAELHEQLAGVYLNRGWPRASLDELAIARSIDGEALSPRITEVDARLRYADFAAAEQLLYDIERIDAVSPAVRRQHRAWELHSMRELRVDVMTGTSTGAQIGSDSWDANAYLYSSPLRDRYRVYGHVHYAQADFNEGGIDYTRYGVGLDFRSPSLEWNTELSRGASRYSDTGLSAAARWHLDDHWTIHAAADSYSNDVPLRGRLNAGVEGRAGELGVDYRWHESRAASASIQRINMSDDNRRTALSGAFYQRLINRPRYKLDGWLRAYASRNTLDNATYFNPESDFSPTITLRNEWLGWRRYERAFLHRLSFSAGTYRQSGYSSSALWVVSYEHDWLLNDRTELIYGISRSMHPYDGVDEFETRLYGTLVWKF